MQLPLCTNTVIILVGGCSLGYPVGSIQGWAEVYYQVLTEDNPVRIDHSESIGHVLTKEKADNVHRQQGTSTSLDTVATLATDYC